MLVKNTIFWILSRPVESEFWGVVYFKQSFPGSSAVKESACNSGDSGSSPGSGRSHGEGIGYPFQYSWASLVAQAVKNPPALWETWVQSVVGKIPWRRAWQPTLVVLPRKSLGQRSLAGCSPWGHEEVIHDWATKHSTQHALNKHPGQFLQSKQADPIHP